MPDSGAKAALQGYRKQALYILHIVLSQSDDHTQFIPEGQEDLAIYINNKLQKVIQVKSYSDSLTPASVKSFFSRVRKLRSEGEIEVQLVSFGPFGNEFQNAWRGDPSARESLTSKLSEWGFSVEDINFLYEQIKLEQVQETNLKQEVYSSLQTTMAGGEPDSAFDLLNNWIFKVSEVKAKITKSTLIDKIESVGRYLAERASHHQEWFQSIIPLSGPELSPERKQELEEEFYQGISARYEHILANVDVSREQKLKLIHDAFSDSVQTIILTGASGQGKTALANRYFHDYVPAFCRFQIRDIDSHSQASRMANALAEHLKIVKADLYIHIDVQPRDFQWTVLVRYLLNIPNIKILVTIRAEDFARLPDSSADLGFPKTIQLEFDETEAQYIYAQLSRKVAVNIQPSFQESWGRFGGQGPLLEFVYMITQTDSLEARLGKQVKRLQDEVRNNRLDKEEFELLRICSVVTAYESRVNIKQVIGTLNLKNATRTFELFEREYLLHRSEDDKYITALHPIRSLILTRLLTNDQFMPWIDLARKVLPSIANSDIEPFLLYAFARRPEFRDDLVECLKSDSIHNWTRAAGITHALLWLGIDEYILENQELIDELKKTNGRSWWIFFQVDLAGTNPSLQEDLLETFQKIKPGITKRMMEYQDNQTSREKVFYRLKDWLDSVEFVPEHPKPDSDWAGLAEIFYWRNRFNQQTLAEMSNISIGEFLNSIPLKTLGEVVSSIYNGSQRLYDQVISPYYDQIMERFKKETNTVFIHDSEETSRAHFIIDFNYLPDSADVEADSLGKDILHDETIQKLSLLRLLKPQYEYHGTQGYGHNIPLLQWPYDPTFKDKVPNTQFPFRWLVKINSTFHNLASWKERPQNWQDYVQKIMGLREQIRFLLVDVKRGLTDYFKRNTPGPMIGNRVDSEQWDMVSSEVNNPPLLPQNAVDEWGFVSETTDLKEVKGTSIDYAQSVASKALSSKHKTVLQAQKKYFNSLANFFQQALSVIMVNSHVGRATSDIQREEFISELNELGFTKDSENLSVYKLLEAQRELLAFQKAFRERYENFINLEHLRKLERQERQILDQIWPIWYHFAFEPEKQWEYADVRAPSDMERTLDDLREGVLQNIAVLPDAGFQVRILSESELWENRPALWLSLEAKDPFAVYGAYNLTIEKLNKAFSDIQNNTKEQVVLEQFWANIIVIPTFKGFNVSNFVWKLPVSTFYDNNDTPPMERQWISAHHIIKPEVLKRLNLKPVPMNTEIPIEKLQKSFGKLYSLVGHLSDLANIPEVEELHVLNRVREYINVRAEEISILFQRVIDELTDVLSAINKRTNTSQEEYISLLVEGCGNIYNDLMPESFENGSGVLELSEFSDWNQEMFEAFSQIELMRLIVNTMTLESL